MPCAGRCDEPIPVLRGDAYLVGLPGQALEERETPLPPSYPGGKSGRGECCFARLRDPARKQLAGYRAGGGWVAWAEMASWDAKKDDHKIGYVNIPHVFAYLSQQSYPFLR